jgi:hypothetical protein
MNPHDCAAFERRIHEVLDRRGALADDGWLQSHRCICSNCAELMDEYEQLTRLVRLPSREVRSSTAPRPRSRPRGRPLARPLATWVSAGLILILLIGLSNAWRSAPWSSDALDRATVSHRSENERIRGRFYPSTAHAIGSVSSPGTGGNLTDGAASDIAVQAQQILATIEELPASLGDLEPYCMYTASLTGVTTLTAPVSFTVDILRRHWSNPRRPATPIRSDRFESFSRNIRQV